MATPKLQTKRVAAFDSALPGRGGIDSCECDCAFGPQQTANDSATTADGPGFCGCACWIIVPKKDGGGKDIQGLGSACVTKAQG